MTRRASMAVATLLALSAASAPVAGNCPEPDELLRRIAALDRRGCARVSRFGAEIPAFCYENAAEHPGRPSVHRDGKAGMGVLVAELPLAPLWRTVNDETHHDDRYFPVRESWIVGGTPRGTQRTLFQYFQQWGIGRWWVAEVTMNRDLFERSNGALWEIWWTDRMGAADTSRPPVRDVARRVRGIDASRGSWLMSPLGESCTLVEFYTWSDPGGALDLAQMLMAKRTIRSSMNGVVRFATEHVCSPGRDEPFVRPDGRPLDAPSPPAGGDGDTSRGPSPRAP